MSRDQRNEDMVRMLGVLSTGFKIIGRAFRAFEQVNNQLIEQYTLSDETFPTQKPTPPVQDIYAGFDTVGESLSDYEFTMRQISDIQRERSARRDAPGYFAGNDDEERDWIAANAAEVPPPKQPVEILERGFEMLGRTFNAFELTMAGKKPKGPNGDAKKEEGKTQRHGAPVPPMNGLGDDERTTPSDGALAAPANGTKEVKGTTASNSAPVALMNGHKTSEQKSGYKGSTNGVHEVGNNGEARLPAKKYFPITQRSNSSKRSSKFSPPTSPSKGSLVRNIKRAKTEIKNDLTTEKPKHLGSDSAQPTAPKSKVLKRSSTFSPPNTSSKRSPVRTIKRAKTGIENDLTTPEEPQHRGSDNAQARADTNNKHVNSESDDIVGIDKSNKTRAPKGQNANGPKSHSGTSSPVKQGDSPVSKYSYSPVKQKSTQDPQQPRKCMTFDIPMPKQQFLNISSVIAAVSAEAPRNRKDVDSDDPYGQALYTDRRWR